MPQVIKIRPAFFAEHKYICAIAKQHKHTRDFSNIIFSGEDCYQAGRIRIAHTHLGKEELLGFTCFRRRKRDGVTVLYFIAVDSTRSRKGVGRRLMADLERLARPGAVELKVVKANPAVAFYAALGYEQAGEAFNGDAWVMRKALP